MKQKKRKTISKKNINFFESIYKNVKKKTTVKFGDIEIKKQKFHQHKRPTSIKNIDINKILVSSKVSFSKKGFKYFICYKDAKKIDPCVYFS